MTRTPAEFISGADDAHPSLERALYGAVPSWLKAPRDVAQLSPLVPGSGALEGCGAEALQQLTMLAPAGTIERRYAMALAMRALVPGAPFTILAPRDKGGARVAAELRSFGCDVTEDSKQHYRICTGIRPEKLKIDEALADGAPRFDTSLQLWTQPGVFSWDRPDTGSVLLAAHLLSLSGRGADLGCGIGYLSRAVLALPGVTHLTLLDIDRRAVEQAAKNVDAARTTILWRDITRECPLSGLDFVVMNPPFHDGGIEDRTLGQRFIERAAEALRPGGSCWLVANRHLPYEDGLRAHFTQVRTVTEQDGFKIFEAVK